MRSLFSLFRKARLALGVATAALLLAACGSSGGGSGKHLVYFIFNGYTPPFFAPMAQGIKDASKHYPNLDIKILSANASASTEISQLHEASAAGAAGIILNPVDESVTSSAKQIASGGTPVVTLDRDVNDPSARLAFIGDDDVVLGSQEAQACLAQLGAHRVSSPWNVVDLQGTLGASTAVNRETGFQQVLKPDEQQGKLKLVLNQAANFDTGAAQKTVSEFVAKTHNIQLVLASNDAMALGAINALQSAGLTPGSKAYVCGADAQPESLAAIKSGSQLVTVTHSPYVEAFWSVEAMSNYLKNKIKPPASRFPNGTVHIPQIVVTKAKVSKVAGWGTPPTVPALPYGQAQAYPSSATQ